MSASYLQAGWGPWFQNLPVLMWRIFPWPAGRGRYLVKGLLERGRSKNGARPMLTDAGWLYLELGSDNLQNQLFWTGEHYEREVTKLIYGLDLRAKNVLDVGGHAGYHTLLFADRVGENGTVSVFEPLPDMALRLEKAVKLNHYDSRVAVINKAVSSEAGKLTLFKHSDCGRTSLGRHDGVIEELEVETIALDDWIDLNMKGDHRKDRSPDLIKMDIEGAEWMALKGLERTLNGTKPPILILEVHQEEIRALGGSVEELIGRLKQLDHYSLSFVDHRTGPTPLNGIPDKQNWHLLAQPI